MQVKLMGLMLAERAVMAGQLEEEEEVEVVQPTEQTLERVVMVERAELL